MFTNNLKVELLKNKGKVWTVLEELHYYHEKYGDIIVPKGFSTNFASVPRIPVIFELVGDRGHTAAVVHDYLYSTESFDISRKEADKILYQALIDTRVTTFRAKMMYIGVRAFGWLYFKK